jgi:hypothetical protein
VICLAPRALGDSVRPRRLAGVVVRPLNFTVRRQPRKARRLCVLLPWWCEGHALL